MNNIMSKEHNKKESHQKCDACDFQKLKQLENNPIIRKLHDQIEQLNFRLAESRNENQMLKRNLQFVKKVVRQEVDEQDIDFHALMKYGTQSGSKGHQENLLILKNRVQELKEYLKELEEGLPSPQEAPSEESVKHQMPNARKKLWSMELERRLARENAEKDINPLVQECCELRKSLDVEKKKYRERIQEVKLLRAELQSQTEKNEEDSGIRKSFETLEKQLEETLAERADIRQNLDGARARNKRLTEELTTLKEELQLLQKKTDDSKGLTDSMTSSNKNIQEAIDAEKKIVQQNAERYKEELKVLQDNHMTDCEILDHLQCIIYDRNALVDDLNEDVDFTIMKGSEEIDDSVNLEKLSSKETTAEEMKAKNNTSKDNADSVAEDEVDSELKIRKLRLEYAKYKALCEASKMESDRLSQLIENQDKKMNEMAVQVIETGRLVMQKNAEKKELMEKVNRLQRSMLSKRRKGKLHVQPKSRLEEAKIKSDAQRGENEFLRNFLRSSVCSKAKDLQEIKSFIMDSKHFFKACLSEVEELLESNWPEYQSGPVSVSESENELNI